MAALASAASIKFQYEKRRLICAFLLFEAWGGYTILCKVPSFLHIPLHIFVIAALMTGISSARYAAPGPPPVLTSSSLMTGLSTVVSHTETHAGHPSPQ
ncbi:hypothetical protein DFP72DRAFT_1165436 [Ephemerocybe angulata]|uniref:Uncharacterized protein n=1 Tax=Ephemerocybe angulata TaxID=980116 RepID=A0A8H6IA40_9AGAR|nr:hypothetical protein DFP72DRAFT_1165436 [Tulosesus angulatus]